MQLLGAVLTLLFFAVLSLGVTVMLAVNIGVAIGALIQAVFWAPFGRGTK